MSADLGPDPADLRHDVLVEQLGEIRGLLHELVDEMRAMRIALDTEGVLLRQAIREARR